MAWYDAITNIFRTPETEEGPQAPKKVGQGSVLSSTGYNAISNVAEYLSLEKARRSYYGDFDLMDAEAPEAKRALDSFTDSSMQDGGSGTPLVFRFKDEGAGEVIRSVNRTTGIDARAWAMLRAFRKYGDHFAELVFDESGVLRVVKDLPVRDIQRVIDKTGRPAEDYPWKQVQDLAGSINDATTLAKFREWQIVHWGDVPAGKIYAYSRSQLAGARRPWKAVELACNAMLAERIMHTGTRLAFQVNVTGLSGDEAMQYMREVKRDYERTTFNSATTGREDPYGPSTPLDDIWIPWSSGGPQKPVDVIRFGAEIGEIADVKFHYGRFLSALEVPRYELGLDEDIRSKAATNVIDAGYIRRIVRARTVYLTGLVKVYNRALYAAGYDSALTGDYKDLYDVNFYPLQLIDEKLRWEIAKLRAEVAKIYSFDLATVSPEFVLTYFLGIEEEEAAEMLSGMPKVDRAVEVVEKKAAESVGDDPTIRMLRTFGEKRSAEIARTFADLREAKSESLSPINGIDNALPE